MSVPHSRVARNWVASIEGTEDFSRRPSHLQGFNVNPRGDRILSYGWWEMARIVRTAKNEPSFWLVNGDRYSPSTSQHQGNVRNAIADKSNRPSIIVPYTALSAAGIEPDSILPIEIRADRFIEHDHSIPADFPLPVMRPSPHNSEDYQAEHGERRVHDVKFGVTHCTHGYDYELSRRGPLDQTSYDINGCEAELSADGERWEWKTRTHFLGDSLFSARVTEQHDRPATPEEIAAYERLIEWTEAHQGAGYPYNGTLEYESFIQRYGERPEPSIVHKFKRTTRHNVGLWGRTDEPWQYEVRETRSRRVRFLSSFDYNERIPLYFLAELPRGKVQTVDEAYELLKPRLVKMAEAGGIAVERQGDIFAIPTELTTAEVKRLTPRGNGQIVKRPEVLGTNHEPSQVMFATGDRVYARGCLYHTNGDHARCKLGDGETWHLLLRNTVPRTVTNDAQRSVRV